MLPGWGHKPDTSPNLMFKKVDIEKEGKYDLLILKM
jgi:hypothetical protein